MEWNERVSALEFPNDKDREEYDSDNERSDDLGFSP